MQKLSNLRNQILFLPLEKWITFQRMHVETKILWTRFVWKMKDKQNFGSILHVELVEFLEIGGISHRLAYEWFIIIFFWWIWFNFRIAFVCIAAALCPAISMFRI